MVLADTFSLDSAESSWLYNAIVCARPVLHELKSIQVVESKRDSAVLDEGSRKYGDYTYIVVR